MLAFARRTDDLRFRVVPAAVLADESDPVAAAADAEVEGVLLFDEVLL